MFLHTAAYLPCGFSWGAAREEEFLGVTDTASASAKEAESLGGPRWLAVSRQGHDRKKKKNCQRGSEPRH